MSGDSRPDLPGREMPCKEREGLGVLEIGELVGRMAGAERGGERLREVVEGKAFVEAEWKVKEGLGGGLNQRKSIVDGTPWLGEGLGSSVSCGPFEGSGEPAGGYPPFRTRSAA